MVQVCHSATLLHFYIRISTCPFFDALDIARQIVHMPQSSWMIATQRVGRDHDWRAHILGFFPFYKHHPIAVRVIEQRICSGATLWLCSGQVPCHPRSFATNLFADSMSHQRLNDYLRKIHRLRFRSGNTIIPLQTTRIMPSTEKKSGTSCQKRKPQITPISSIAYSKGATTVASAMR